MSDRTNPTIGLRDGSALAHGCRSPDLSIRSARPANIRLDPSPSTLVALHLESDSPLVRRTAYTVAPLPAPSAPSIAIWVDSFSDCFDDGREEPALQVLAEAGYAPRVIKQSACCGLTWISTGQRTGARRQMLAALDVLAPIAEGGTPIVGLEPSCLATWRGDAAEPIGDDPRTPTVIASMRTLAEALSAAPTWEPPDLSSVEVIAQPHCHHTSILGWEPTPPCSRRLVPR